MSLAVGVGRIRMLDNCGANTVTVAQMRAIFNAHTHTENNVTGGQTSGPSGDIA